MEKHTVPNIPSTQHVLEDLAEIGAAVQINNTIGKFQDESEGLQKAHTYYLNFLQLQGDLARQDVLNSKLDELNQKLVESIANLRKQT